MKVISSIYIDDSLLKYANAEKINISKVLTDALSHLVSTSDSSEVKQIMNDIKSKEKEIESLQQVLQDTRLKVKLRREIINYFTSNFKTELTSWINDYQRGDDEIKEQIFKEIKLNNPSLKYSKGEVFEAFNHLGVIPYGQV